MVIKTLLTALLITLVQPAEAQDYETGKAAYKRGDYPTALQHFRPLAKRGHAKAQSNLGFMYSKGHGVTQNYVRSISWLSKAAVQNDAHAQHNLGIIHGNGLGVPKDHFLAYLWFTVASANGHKSSAIKRKLAATLLEPEDQKIANEIARKCRLKPIFCGKYAVPGKDI